ncbi:MAG: AI-2E family transporter [Candidatus Eisenbacteria bacterium]|nr:AI-2E family transporter [Candidatus Eisenbacteria bacterium]
MSIEKSSARNLVLWALGAFLLIWLLVKLKGILVLVILSVLFAYVLDPAVSLLERVKLTRGKRLSRKIAVFLVVLISVAIIGTALLIAIPRLAEEVASFAMSFPEYAFKARELLLQVMPRLLERNLPPSLVSSIENEISGAIASVGGLVARSLYSVVSTIIHILSLLIIPAMAVYLLIDGKDLKQILISRFSGGKRDRLEGIVDSLNVALSSYIRGQTIVCLSMGVACGIVFSILGLPYSLLLGVTAGLMEAVPIVGFITTLILTCLAGLSHSVGLAITGGILYIVANQVLGLVLTPRVMGRHMKLHPFLVLLSIMCGIQLAGFVGAVLALPVAASARVLLNSFLSQQGSGK